MMTAQHNELYTDAIEHYPILYTRMAMGIPTGTVFENNRTQAVRLPAETRFPETVKKVTVRVSGKERILTPVESTWDSFFLDGPAVSDDFLSERADQHQEPRESL